MFRLLSRIKLRLLLAVCLGVPPIALAGTASAKPDSTAVFPSLLRASCEYKDSEAGSTVSCPDTISIGSDAGSFHVGVLKFDLGGFSGTILEANLELFVTDSFANDEGYPELKINQYNGSWTDPAATAEAPAAWPSYGELHSRTFDVTDEGGQWVKFNIAPLVRSSIAKGADEIDLILEGSWADAPEKRYFHFASSDTFIPQLNIVYTTSPVRLSVPHTRIAAGDGFTLSLQNDGTVKAYGRIQDRMIEVPDSLAGVQAVYASDECGYAITGNGSVAALGEGCTVPDEISDDHIVGLALNGYATAALRNDGTIVSWGSPLFPEQWGSIYGPFKSITGGTMWPL